MPTFNTALQLDESAEIVEARLAPSLSTVRATHSVNVQPGLIVISRRYRPGWAIALGIVWLFFFLLGLLFFLVKNTETLSISVSPRGDGGSTVIVAGEATPWVISNVQTTLTSPVSRPCPNCKRAMRREVTACPHCGFESNPWIHHAGVWWLAPVTTEEWQWFDERAGFWRWYRDGTPRSPGITDTLPNFRIDPALVKPPGTDAPSASAALSESVGASDLEQLAALHERGALSDEEFQAAKARILGL